MANATGLPATESILTPVTDTVVKDLVDGDVTVLAVATVGENDDMLTLPVEDSLKGTKDLKTPTGAENVTPAGILLLSEGTTEKGPSTSTPCLSHVRCGIRL
jgi:hypothetical protein